MEKITEVMAPDLSYLEALSDGDAEFEAEMIETYLGEIPAHIGRLQDGLADSDWKKLSEELHSLKSKLSIMGFLDLYRLVEKLEAHAKNRTSLEEVAAKVPDVCRLLQSSLVIAEKELLIRK